MLRYLLHSGSTVAASVLTFICFIIITKITFDIITLWFILDFGIEMICFGISVYGFAYSPILPTDVKKKCCIYYHRTACCNGIFSALLFLFFVMSYPIITIIFIPRLISWCIHFICYKCLPISETEELFHCEAVVVEVTSNQTENERAEETLDSSSTKKNQLLQQIDSLVKMRKKEDLVASNNLQLIYNMSNIPLQQNKCTICLEDLENKRWQKNHKLKLQCDHVFHVECIKRWISTKNLPECPNCRMKMIV